MARVVRSRIVVWAWLLAAGVTVLLGMAPKGAAEPVATVASLQGSVEIGRGGTWVAASVGSKVAIGDTMRTGQPGRVRLVFRDGSVVNMADGSQLVIDDQVFVPAGGEVHTLLHLLTGKVRALVSKYYTGKQARYQVYNSTAVAGVRGTEFIMLMHPGSDVTEVVGITHRVEVHSVRDRVGHGVFVGPRELTVVKPGEFPTPPRPISDVLFRQYLEGLDFAGNGQPEGLEVFSPVLDGRIIPPPDRAESAGPAVQFPVVTELGLPEESTYQQPDASTLIGQPPAAVSATQGPTEVGIPF